MDDLRACLAGFIVSVFGSSWLGVIQDIAMAFILGAVGAVAGWIINRSLNWFFPKKK